MSNLYDIKSPNEMAYIFIYNVIQIKSNFLKLKRLSGNQKFILVASEYCINALSPENASSFDEIYPMSRNFHHADYEVVESVVQNYLELYGVENVRLFTNEDSAQLVCAKIHEQYNIPGFNTSDVLQFVDKTVSKKMLKDKVRLPKFTLFDKDKYQKDKKKYLNKLAEDFKFPIFIKPIDLVSSLYTYRINDFNTLEVVANDITNYEYDFEVDEFIDGDLYHCDILMSDGEIVFFMAAKYAYPLALFSKGSVFGSIPVTDNALFIKFNNFANDVVKNLNCSNGCYHLEAFINKKDELVFLEIAARTPGALIPMMYEIQLGFHLEELHYLAQMGLLSKDPVNLGSNKFVAWVTYPKQDGVVADFKMPEIEAKYKFIKHVGLGENVTSAKSLLDGACSFVVWDNSLEKVQTAFEFLKSYKPVVFEKAKTTKTEDYIDVLTELFDTMPHIFWKNREGVYLGCNLNQAKSFGYTVDEYVGKTTFELFEPSTAQQISEADEKVMQGDGIITLEETMLTEHGEKNYLSQKIPRYNAEGEVIGMLGFSMDITEIKQQEKMAYVLSQEIQDMVKKCLEDVQYAVQACKINILHKKTGKKLSKVSRQQDVQLTRRQREILYYLSLNKAPKDIAAIFSIIDGKSVSSGTVQAIIDKQLYSKLGVYNVGQLLERANLLNLVPFVLD